MVERSALVLLYRLLPNSRFFLACRRFLLVGSCLLSHSFLSSDWSEGLFLLSLIFQRRSFDFFLDEAR